MENVHAINTCSWNGPFTQVEQHDAVAALESGKVLVFPALRFRLGTAELGLLTPAILSGAKNVSLEPSGRLKHAAADKENSAMLQSMMQRFAGNAGELATALVPAYRARLERARTSFRPAEIEGRRASVLKDDTRLHVDAFPTTPMRGRRILRLFANLNVGAPRVWNVGEPFAEMADKLLPGLKLPPRGLDWLLAKVGVTKSIRSPYDNLMLALHNRAKRDESYWRTAPRTRIDFPPGTVWMCFTDQVMHAALKGQHALEQTFHVPVEAMVHPELAPLRVLERKTGRALV
jgi:hypothetical protein